MSLDDLSPKSTSAEQNVGGHVKLPAGGHETCPLVARRIAAGGHELCPRVTIPPRASSRGWNPLPGSMTMLDAPSMPGRGCCEVRRRNHPDCCRVRPDRVVSCRCRAGGVFAPHGRPACRRAGRGPADRCRVPRVKVIDGLLSKLEELVDRWVARGATGRRPLHRHSSDGVEPAERGVTSTSGFNVVMLLTPSTLSFARGTTPSSRSAPGYS